MGLFNAVMALSGVLDTDVSEQEKLARHTSFRIGGPAALFVTCHSYHALRHAIEQLEHESVPWVILGRGSNVLVSDDGYEGAVVTLGNEFSRTLIAEDGCTVTVGAGTVLARLVNEAYAKGLSGLEFAVGIPGTVGGAVSMDAGTRDEWIGRLVQDVLTYKPGEGIKHYRGSDVVWGYRATSLPHDEILLEVTLALKQAPKTEIRDRMERYLSRRRHTQPQAVASCGSVFRNPPEGSVGKMVEDCGLKGFSVGGAQVSEVHANVIVNTGSASASDVLAVMQEMYGKVREKFGVELQPEVKFLGFSRR